MNQNELIAEPKSPINPYTGVKFTYVELSKCYMNFSIDKIQLPLELTMFKKSNFSIKNMLYNFKTHFIRKSIATYLEDITNAEWNKIVWEFYLNNSFKDQICYKCLIEIAHIKKILNPTLQEYIYCINIDNYKSSYQKMFQKICKFYKIEPQHKHPSKHTKKPIKPQGFKFDNIEIITTDFSSNSNYVFGVVN